ncbi:MULTISPECIES: DUF3224 domain-containing protein [unclassified Streptomyces]|uniref:DUF3224 domain-containing protein n=1 Tax=unclassified Streptomyces TaxID=2593676 RepID=UPI000DC7B59D|nr:MULTISPECIES: DUF3224 domain-containing protein [unclassified Streptomyces]AWZ10042.1 DUF3224 domain-containing protein [Streptomyces sp. ICC4]AWZ17634.1 DUF3224 domain-containing protein [Streptomyces sp. ICC1]
MRASGTFEVVSFTPAPLAPEPAVETGLPVGVATMEKHYEGESLTGRSATLFTAAFDQETGVGSYVAMESFEGSLAGREGAFNFVHSDATDGGPTRGAEHFAIVPGSGTAALKGITGAGGLRVDENGVHHIWFDYALPA